MKDIDFATTDDGVTIACRGGQAYAFENVFFNNERVGDRRTIYTCVDNRLLKLKGYIVDVVCLGGGECEIVTVITRRGNRVVKL